MDVLDNLQPVCALGLSVPHDREAEEQRFTIWQTDGWMDFCLMCTQEHNSFWFERTSCSGDRDRARGKEWPNSDLTANHWWILTKGYSELLLLVYAQEDDTTNSPPLLRHTSSICTSYSNRSWFLLFQSLNEHCLSLLSTSQILFAPFSRNLKIPHQLTFSAKDDLPLWAPACSHYFSKRLVFHLFLPDHYKDIIPIKNLLCFCILRSNKFPSNFFILLQLPCFVPSVG